MMAAVNCSVSICALPAASGLWACISFGGVFDCVYVHFCLVCFCLVGQVDRLISDKLSDIPLLLLETLQHNGITIKQRLIKDKVGLQEQKGKFGPNYWPQLREDYKLAAPAQALRIADHSQPVDDGLLQVHPQLVVSFCLQAALLREAWSQGRLTRCEGLGGLEGSLPTEGS